MKKMKGRYYCEENDSPTYQAIIAEKLRFEKKEIISTKRGKRKVRVKVTID
tara:strand:+ start:14275 stop:14427 length:153 start_codon:yes stop_codon:yes gene_type:complete